MPKVYIRKTLPGNKLYVYTYNDVIAYRLGSSDQERAKNKLNLWS
jgi:hypothetical protein